MDWHSKIKKIFLIESESMFLSEEQLEEGAGSFYYWVSPDGEGIEAEPTHTAKAYKEIVPSMEDGPEAIRRWRDVNMDEDMRVINYMIRNGWVRLASYIRYDGEFLMVAIQCDQGAPKSVESITRFILGKINEVQADNVHVTIDNAIESMGLQGPEYRKLGRYL